MLDVYPPKSRPPAVAGRKDEGGFAPLPPRLPPGLIADG